MHQQEKFKMSLNAAKGVNGQVNALMQEVQQAIEKKFISRMPSPECKRDRLRWRRSAPPAIGPSQVLEVRAPNGAPFRLGG